MLAAAYRRRVLRDDRGQIALVFVALVGLVVLITPPLMNLGEVARIKTRTAIAADAGAISAASYGSSAANHGARIARYTVWVYWVVQSIFAIPFCIQAIGVAEALITIAVMINQWFVRNANYAMTSLFYMGKANGIFTAISNASIDDTSGNVDALIQADQAALIPPPGGRPLWPNDRYEYFWTREGITDQDSSLLVEITYPPEAQAPRLNMGGFPLFYWFWVPFCFLWCFPAFGWQAMGPMPAYGDVTNTDPPVWDNSLSQAGVSGYFWIPKFLNFMQNLTVLFNLPGFCGYPTMFPLPRWRNAARASSISNATNQVTMRVTRRREPGAQVAWWTMQYPDTLSSATARYTGANVRLNPFVGPGDNSVTELIAVQ